MSAKTVLGCSNFLKQKNAKSIRFALIDSKRRRSKRLSDFLQSKLSPEAIICLICNDIPEYVREWNNKRQLIKYIRELNSIHFSSIRDLAYDRQLMNPALSTKVRIPNEAVFRPASAKLFVKNFHKELRNQFQTLVSGHRVCISSMARYLSIGFDRYAYESYTEEFITPIGGEWSLVYPEEIRSMMPSISWNTARKRKRSIYLVQTIRNKQLNPIELRVYSTTLKPILKLSLELARDSSIPINATSWWTGDYNRVLAYQRLKLTEKQNNKKNEIQRSSIRASKALQKAIESRRNNSHAGDPGVLRDLESVVA